MPPQNFSGLTDDELRAMEGHERANVEARIKCLRNIQVLLDAAVMEMQQYSSVVSNLEMASRRPSTSVSQPVTTPTTTATTTVSNGASAASTGARPKVKPEAVEVKRSKEPTGVDDNDEVRKRRLEKFGNNQSNNSD